jgi:hypothetical protein
LLVLAFFLFVPFPLIPALAAFVVWFMFTTLFKSGSSLSFSHERSQRFEDRCQRVAKWGWS